MSYAVTWLPSAEHALLQIILSRPDRAAVVRALDHLGETLQREGSAAGESRESGFRVLFELPLAVKFWGEEAGGMVTVVDVWVIGEPDEYQSRHTGG